MKKQSVSTIAKTIFLGSILSAAILGSTTAHANPSSGELIRVDSIATNAEIKYIGVDNDEYLSFTVRYSNPTGEKFTLLVLDENGEGLFRSTYSDKKFRKAFKLPKASINNLTFLIQGAKESYKEVFDVSVNTREIADVVVSKN